MQHDAALRAAWRTYGDSRVIVAVKEVSAHVSTNHVYRVALDDGSAVIAKFSWYGSYFLFCEDHDRLHRSNVLLRGTRYEHLMADVLTVDGQPFVYYDGTVWAVFYEEVSQRGSLPRILSDAHVNNFGEEIASFHRECTRIAPQMPRTSTSIKSDAINLLERVTDPRTAASFEFDSSQRDLVRQHAHEFLLQLQRLGYDDLPKIPALLDWNLGNFSVEFKGDRFQLFSRWDYDWFRIDTRMLDFYFLSRVSSETGDRTVFTYSSHTLLEPRFRRFLKAYHQVFPLTENEILLLKESYRFFILNYVIRSGDHFFEGDLWRRLQREAVAVYLPALDSLDLQPLVDDVLG
jgi:hypothetical protein